jgi:hypothetical protein
MRVLIRVNMSGISSRHLDYPEKRVTPVSSSPPLKVALGGKITAGAGKAHGTGNPDIKPVALKCGFVDTCKEHKAVCCRAFYKGLAFS